MVGKLIYLSHTSLDIVYVVGVLSRFMHKPPVQHMGAIMMIFRYLKGTLGRGIMFMRNSCRNLKPYTNVDCANYRDERNTPFGYFILVGGLITWKSKKLKVTTVLSAEVEFRGMTKAITKVLWIIKCSRNWVFLKREVVNIIVIIRQLQVF